MSKKKSKWRGEVLLSTITIGIVFFAVIGTISLGVLFQNHVEKTTYRSIVSFSISPMDSLEMVDCRYMIITSITSKDSLLFDMPEGRVRKYKLIKREKDNIYAEGGGRIIKFITEVAPDVKRLYFRPNESTYVVLSTDSIGVCK